MDGTIASFINLKTYINLHSPFGICTPRMAVLHGLLQGLKKSCDFKVSIIICSPTLEAVLSCFKVSIIICSPTLEAVLSCF
jgi:hypothetical protein